MYIFISYATPDVEIAKQCLQALEKENMECFFAPRDIQMGHIYAKDILDAINRSDVFLLLLSKAADNSPHVLREVERAVSKKLPLIVYKLENFEISKSMEYFLMTHQWLNRENDQDIDRLVCRIKTMDGQNEADTVAAGRGQKTMHTDVLLPHTEENGSTAGRKRKSRLWICAAVLLAFAVLAGGLAIWRSRMQKDSLFADAKVGDVVSFGTYLEQPIEWIVLRQNADGTKVLIARNILTMKSYDAAEGGTYNLYEGTDYWTEKLEGQYELQTLVRGNSNWETSNIRTWLNSSERKVEYADMPPKTNAASEKKNGYDREPGFLHGFTEDERALMVETVHQSKGNALSAAKVETTDLVYLLSLEELEWFDLADLEMDTCPTETAIEKDETGWWRMYADGDGHFYWWLRDAADTSACEGYLAGYAAGDEAVSNYPVGTEGFGIRPAVTVK